MMDILDDLRSAAELKGNYNISQVRDLLKQAASEIERLRNYVGGQRVMDMRTAHIRRLEDALQSLLIDTDPGAHEGSLRRSRTLARIALGTGVVPMNRGALLYWQPIETAPKDGTELLLYVPGYIRGARRMEGPIVIGAWVEDHSWGRTGAWWSDICDPYEGHSGTTSDPVDLEPTHWMPLPEAPK